MADIIVKLIAGIIITAIVMACAAYLCPPPGKGE